MTSKPKDTFFDLYTFGTITSPNDIGIDDLLAWFRDNDIIAGVAPVDKDGHEFYVPMVEDPESSKILIGTVMPDGSLDFNLLPAQLRYDLARKFEAYVFMDDDSEDFADWSEAETSERVLDNTATYIVSKAPSESAMVYAYTIKQTVDYARVNNFSLWRSRDYGAWYDYSFMPRELPAFVFSDNYLIVQYKALSEPVHLHATGCIKMSYHDTTTTAWKNTQAGMAMQEISNHHLRPGGGIDLLIRAGVLKKSRAERLIDVLSGEQKDFVAGICKVFDLPESIIQHITTGTMPENSQTARVSNWWRLMGRTMEDYIYEPNPNAGPLQRFLVYISARPLLHWLWMISETVIGGLFVYRFLVVNLDQLQPWWHYLFGLIGVLFIIEAFTSMYLRIRRSLSR